MANEEKQVWGFDLFDRIHVFLTNGNEIVMDKVLWDMSDWGILYGDNRRTQLFPWSQISYVIQLHDLGD